jgi:hypothetical protein
MASSTTASWNRRVGTINWGWHCRWNRRQANAAKPITLPRMRRGWMQVTTPASLRGAGRSFFLDILFHRMSEIAILYSNECCLVPEPLRRLSPAGPQECAQPPLSFKELGLIGSLAVHLPQNEPQSMLRALLLVVLLSVQLYTGTSFGGRLIDRNAPNRLSSG